MIRAARRGVGWSLVAASIVAPSAARAQQPAPPPAPGPSAPALTPALAGSDSLALAKDLNRRGILLLEAGDVTRALDYFERSRAAFPSSKNIANTAICLERLGRYDEAMEFYEELLTQYTDGLDEEDRAKVGPAVAQLLKKLGNLMVSSNVAGTLVVDGRARGKLPRTAPLRVRAGRHLIRVLKDGYIPFETRLEIKAGDEIAIDAKLEPLVNAGQLRVEDPNLAEAEVFVDGVLVGKAPWEGTLAAGRHLAWTRKEDAGSAPAAVLILGGQTALMRARSSALGPSARVRVEPSTAQITIDGVAIGRAAWEGRLPLGKHVITAAEPGYHTQTATLDPAADAPAARITLVLAVDSSHPRWPTPGHMWIEGFGGYAIGGTLGSKAEEACPDRCDGDPIGHGFVAGLRGGYRFPFGLSLELGGGYMAFGASFERVHPSAFVDRNGQEVPLVYALEDELRVRGPFAGGGASYRLGVSSHVGLIGRAMVGVLFASSSDPISGTATTTGEPTPVLLDDRSTTLRSAAVFVLPAVGAELKLGPVDLGVSFGLAIFPTEGPAFAHERFGATPKRSADPKAAGNAPLSNAIADERAYGSFVLSVPQISLGHTF